MNDFKMSFLKCQNVVLNLIEIKKAALILSLKLPL